MARRKITAGITGVSVPIEVDDTSSTTGAGLGSLVFNTSGLVAEYRRQGQSSWTSITLAAGTLGTWSSGGFIADGSLSGAYELGIPDAAFSSGKWCLVRLYGAANMGRVLLEFELDAINYQDGVHAGLTAIPNAAPAATGGLPTVGTGNGQANLLLGVVDANLKTTDPSFKYDGIAQGGAASTITLASTASTVDNAYKYYMIRTVGGTGPNQGPFRCTDYVGSTKVATVAGTFSPTPSTDTQYIVDPPVAADLYQWLDVAPLALSSQLVQAAVAAPVTVGTNNDKTGYALAQAFPSNFAALGITAGGKVSGVVLADTLTTYTGNTVQTGDNFARIGAAGAGLTAVGDTAGTTTLVARLTAARAGYLDNLNVGGVVASHADVLALNTATALARVITSGQYLKPASGSTSYPVTLVLTNLEGLLTDADGAGLGVSGLTTVVTNGAGTDRSSNFSGWTHGSTGRYEATYAVASSAADEPLVLRASGAVGGQAFVAVVEPAVADAFALAFNSTDRSNLTALFNVAPAHTPLVDVTGAAILTTAYDAAKAAAQASSLATLATAVGTPAQAAQIPANFATIVVTAGAFSTTALENAPGGGSGGVTAGQIVTAIFTNPYSSTDFNTAGSVGAAIKASLKSDGVLLSATQGNYAPAKAGDAMALTSGERSTLTDAILSNTVDTLGAAILAIKAKTDALPTHFTNATFSADGVFAAAALAAGPSGGGGSGSDTPGTTTLLGRLTSGRATNLDSLDAAVSSRSTYAGGAVASVTAPVTVGTNSDKAGYSLGASGVDAIAVEAGINLRQALSPILAAAAGTLSGAGTGTVTVKGANTSTTRIVAATDGQGDRTSVTLSLPS